VLHRIKDFKQKLIIFEGKKKYSYNGYVFLDKFDSCIIIVYGEDKRDEIHKHLNESE